MTTKGRERYAAILLGIWLGTGGMMTAAEGAPFVGGPGVMQQSDGGKPYRVVRLPQNLHLQKSVIEIFSFGCTYCRRMNPALLNWGKSIPRGYTFTQMPALIEDQYFPMTMATFGVYETAPEKIPAFEEKAFSLVQTYKQPMDQASVYLTAANEAGINVSQLVKTIQGPTVRALTAEDAEIMKITQITKTPSLIICGKYVIDPSDTHGNASMFIQLANGLLSRCMMEQGVQ